MKTLIATLAVLASTSAFAENGFVRGGNNSDVNAKGNATGNGEATFTMSFSGKGNMNGDTSFNGASQTNAGSEYQPEFYGYSTPYYNFPAQEK